METILHSFYSLKSIALGVSDKRRQKIIVTEADNDRVYQNDGRSRALSVIDNHDGRIELTISIRGVRKSKKGNLQYPL